MGDDLEGVLTSQVQGGGDGQDTLGGKQEEYGQDVVRSADLKVTRLKMMDHLKVLIASHRLLTSPKGLPTHPRQIPLVARFVWGF